MYLPLILKRQWGHQSVFEKSSNILWNILTKKPKETAFIPWKVNAWQDSTPCSLSALFRWLWSITRNSVDRLGRVTVSLRLLRFSVMLQMRMTPRMFFMKKALTPMLLTRLPVTSLKVQLEITMLHLTPILTLLLIGSRTTIKICLCEWRIVKWICWLLWICFLQVLMQQRSTPYGWTKIWKCMDWFKLIPEQIVFWILLRPTAILFASVIYRKLRTMQLPSLEIRTQVVLCF